MRRWVLLLMAVLFLPLTLHAPAQAETELDFDGIYASVTIPDVYHIITPENLETQRTWLEGRGLDADELTLDFLARGVLLRGYDDENGRVLEITAIRDVDAENHFDVDQQTVAWRAEYRKGHLSGADWGLLGYVYDSAEWKKTNQYGRFLMLKYRLRVDGETVRRGYQRRTIRNGYTITLDIQVTGRSLAAADDRAMNKVIDTWVFTQTLPMPPMPVMLEFSTPPPVETNTNSFKVRGTSNARASITALLVGIGSGEAKTFTGNANANGSFTLDIKMPGEDTYTLIILAQDGDEIESEMSFNIVYQKTLLPVNFTSPIPAELTGDTMTIAGTSTNGVTIQLIVNDTAVTKKTGSGKAFSFKTDTSDEGEYNIVMLFTKKGLVERRYTASLTRTWSETERYEKTVKSAVKPAYGTLTAKLDGYMGRVMTYTGYVTQVTRAGDEWLIFTALTKRSSGYSNIIVVSTDKEPTYAAGEPYRLYARLDGTHVLYDADGQAEGEYPYFVALYLESAD